jgi:hypothetical protein
MRFSDDPELQAAGEGTLFVWVLVKGEMACWF